MAEIAASIDVPASARTVWDVLMDVESYAQWNTLLRIEGEFSLGESVGAKLSIPGFPTVSFRPTIVGLEPRRELRWRSSLFGFDAEHAFLLEPSDDDETRFVQYERISGPFTNRLVGRFERRLRRGFEEMNVGLRRRATELTTDHDEQSGSE